MPNVALITAFTKQKFTNRVLGADLTHAMLNAISHGKLSCSTSYLGLSIPCYRYQAVTHYKDHQGKKKSHAIHWKEI